MWHLIYTTLNKENKTTVRFSQVLIVVEIRTQKSVEPIDPPCKKFSKCHKNNFFV